MRENTLEESFTESFKTEEGWGEEITSGILVRERERERELRLGRNKE
jgi:hypothetical protein